MNSGKYEVECMQNRNEENSYNEKKYSEETYGERKQEKPRDQERNSEEGMRSTDHEVIPETDNHVSGGKRPWSEEGRHGISRQGAILITSLCLVAAAGFATFYPYWCYHPFGCHCCALARPLWRAVPSGVL